jgi:hypothetical protein
MTEIRQIFQVTEGRHAVRFVTVIRTTIIGASAADKERSSEDARDRTG